MVAHQFLTMPLKLPLRELVAVRLHEFFGFFCGTLALGCVRPKVEGDIVEGLSVFGGNRAGGG
jgi:hypothetical protein